MNHTFALVALLGFAPLVASAPVPKTGQPRLIAVTSHKDGLYGIYLVHPDTGESKRLSDLKDFHYGPAWSPDGTRIAFVSSRTSRNGDSEVWTMKADGTDVRQLTKAEASCGYHQWSPDGTRLSFMMGKDGKDWMYTADAATGKLTRLTDGSFPCDRPAWSPDGKRLVYARRAPWAIHTMSPDGTDDQKLPDTDGGRNPAWSPDGKRIAYAAYVADSSPGWRVFTVGADGKNKKQVTTNANNGHNLFPQWSPDGTRIAFETFEDGVAQVAVVGAAGGAEKVITSGERAH